MIIEKNSLSASSNTTLEWDSHIVSKALGITILNDHFQNQASKEILGFSIDTRTLKKDNLFICLKGEKNNAHDYIGEAYQKGATHFIIDENFSFPSTLKDIEKKSFFYRVPDTERALGDLARFHRKRIQACIIAITGSNGKTSTKELLASLLTQIIGKENIYSTIGNYNNHLGLPLSILQVKGNESYIVLEMGMNHSGEIKKLCEIARPHHAIITNISEAHIENFNSIEEIAQAKLEITSYLEKDSLLIYNKKCVGVEMAMKIAQKKQLHLHLFETPKKIKISRVGLNFKWERNKKTNTIYAPRVFNEGLANNLVACLYLLESLHFKTKAIVKACKKAVVESKRRFEIIPKKRRGKKAQLLIDDTYNANVASSLEGLKGLRKLLPKGDLAFFLGEMKELGNTSLQSHLKVLEGALNLNYKTIFFCTKEWNKELEMFFIENQKKISYKNNLIQYYKTIFKKNKTFEAHSFTSASSILEHWNNNKNELKKIKLFDGILIKGSRSTRMDLVADYIKSFDYR